MAVRVGKGGGVVRDESYINATGIGVICDGKPFALGLVQPMAATAASPVREGGHQPQMKRHVIRRWMLPHVLY